MRRNTAEEICILLLRHAKELDAALARVLEIEGDTEDYRRYRGYVGRAMGKILLEGLNPLFSEFPELKPPELD
jgi:hypothetical protein